MNIQQNDPMMWVLGAALFFTALAQMLGAFRPEKRAVTPEVRLHNATMLTVTFFAVMAGAWVVGYVWKDVSQQPVLFTAIGLAVLVIVELLLKKLMENGSA